MILSTWRRFRKRFRRHLKSMPGLQWIVLWAIGLFPVLLFPILPSSITVGRFDFPEFLSLWKTVGPFYLPIKWPVYVLWTIFVLVLVPKAFREDKSRAEQSADLRLEGPKRDIQRLEGELEQSKTDLQEQKEQLADMDRVMRDGFAEVGVTPPPRRISLRGGGLTVGAALSRPTLNVGGGSKLARWVKLPVRRFWKWFWG